MEFLSLVLTTKELTRRTRERRRHRRLQELQDGNRAWKMYKKMKMYTEDVQ